MIRHSNYLFVLCLNSFPLLSSLSFFSVVIGIFFILKLEFLVFFLSLLSSILVGLMWWACYSLESFEEGLFSLNLTEGIKFSFLLFISSEIFFFFSFFWSYFHFFLRPLIDLNFNWPPYSVIIFDFIEIPFLNTLLLLRSGVTVTASHFYYFKGKNDLSSFYLFFTFRLGLIFRYFQFLEYNNSFFSYNDSCFGSCFFTLTGFHGLHVIIGRVYLIFVFLRGFNYFSFDFFTPLSFELASWYWHFVDVVWIFLYFFVYVYSCV